jgi:hypothetical protein
LKGLGASIVLCLWVGAAATPAGPESVPEPISAVDLRSYAIDLDVSRHQWHDMLLRHALYRAEYYDEVAPEIRALERRMGLLATVTREDRLEALLPELRATMTSRIRLFSQIDQLDNALFDTLVPSLSDQQRHELRRVRLRRERDRLRGEAILQGEGIAVVDVSAPARMLLREEPEEGPRNDVEWILTTYEDRLTVRERELQRRSARVYEQFVDGLVKAGIASASGPEEQAGAHEKTPAIWLEVTRPARTELARIHALNRRLFADLEPGTPALARRLRHAYCRAVCEDVSMFQMLKLSEGWEEALGSLKGVTPEERTAVEAKLAAWVLSMERVVDENLEGLRVIWENDNLVAGQWAQEDLCEKNLARATRQHEDLFRFLTALLGARSEALVAARRPWSAIPGVDGPLRHETVGAWTHELRRRGAPSFSDVEPVKLADPQQLAARLDWGPDQLELLGTRYKTYAERFRAELARQTSMLHDTYAGRAHTADGAHTMAQRRAMVVPTLNDVDQDLWNSIVAINAREDSSLIRLARGLRHRELLRSAAWHDRARLSINVSQEWRLDLISLLDGHNLSVAPGSAIESCLIKYDTETTRIAKRQHDAALELLEAMETRSMDRSPGANDAELRRAQESLAAAYAEAGGLNQRTLGQLAELLPPDRHEQIVAEYRVRAYARLLRDPNDISPLLGKAMAMEGLDERTRDILAHAGRMYLEEYDRLLSDIREQLALLQGTTLLQTRRELLHTYRGELGRFSFHRFDLNTSMGMLLQSLLTPAQMAEIGGLPPELTGGRSPAQTPGTARSIHENPPAQHQSVIGQRISGGGSDGSRGGP